MGYSSLFFLIFSCISIMANSQTCATKYYNQINLAEQALIKGDLQKSVSIYHDVFQEFNYPFSRNIEQGFYVACYAKNKSVAELFLRKSILNGITRNQYAYYMNLWEKNNVDSKLDLNYDSLRVESMKKIDTTILFKFLEIDAYREVLVNNLKDDSLSKVNYFSQMRSLRDNYIKLVHTYGYPSENIVGSFYNWKLIKRMKNKYNSNLVHKLPVANWSNTKYKYIVISSPTRHVLSLKPGSWFLTHYINPENHTVIDSTLFSILKSGFDSLKTDPLLIVNAMESTRELDNEFALSYYSQLWAYKLKFDYNKKFTLDKSIRSIVNSNRTSYYIRSLEQEELLFKALYELKFSEKISGGISKENAKNLSEEISLFLNIF